MEALSQIHSSAGRQFHAVLAERRERYNQQFRLARHRSRGLDPAEFLTHLKEVVGPIVDAVPHDPVPVCDALVELSLALAARGRLASDAVTDGWRRLLPAVPALLATAPRTLSVAVVNALHHLEISPTGDPARWVDTMLELRLRTADVPEFLTAGAVAAWRHGLAQLRTAALAAAKELPKPLTHLALNAPATGAAAKERASSGLTSSAGPRGERARAEQRRREDDVLADERSDHYTVDVDRLVGDPWLDPAHTDRDANVLLLARRVGGFRGFGGAFRRPPTVSAVDGRWYATDGADAWRVHADRFGVSLDRVAAMPEPGDVGPLVLKAGGVVADTSTGATLELPELADATSWASAGGTLAATTPWTHGILFVARTAG